MRSPFIVYLLAALLALFSAVQPAPAQAPGYASTRFEALRGKTIRSIQIRVSDIFDRPDNYIYRKANELKSTTREQVIRRELYFREGDKVDPFLLEESERILRTLGYLRNVQIVASSVQADQVDLLVQAQDTWTFIPQMTYSSGTGRKRQSVGISENNLLGWGKRAEFLYNEDYGRKGFEGVYDDKRFWGTPYRLLGAFFSRNDGDRTIFLLGKPFRSLVDSESWSVSGDVLDTVGRLFENGDERFIYRQRKQDLGMRYTVASGIPETRLRRFSFGYDYDNAEFEQASAGDYDDLNLDPDEVSSAPALLAENRRFTGPAFSYQSIRQDFVPMNYVDRFERVEDFNLGNDFSASITLAPEFLGSFENALLINANRNTGYRFSPKAFWRGEIGLSTRHTAGGFEDSLLRAESKYYNVIGPLMLRNLSLGRHTFASSFFIDYGADLDKDRELLIGGDNALRGYKSKTFTGNKRYALNLEDRIHIADDLFQLISYGAAFFIDVGGATYEDLGSLIGEHTYADIGAGLRFAFPRSSGTRVFRIDVALPLRDGPDGSDQFSPRIIFAGAQLFGAPLRSETVGPERATVEVGFDR